MRKSFLKEIDQMIVSGNREDITLGLNLLYNNRNDLREIPEQMARRLYIDVFEACYDLIRGIDELSEIVDATSPRDSNRENLYALLKMLRKKEYI
jgi:hypothetical protein